MLPKNRNKELELLVMICVFEVICANDWNYERRKKKEKKKRKSFKMKQFQKQLKTKTSENFSAFKSSLFL